MKHYQVLVSPSANKDFVEMVIYIRDVLKNPSAALRHVQTYESALRSLESMPNRNAVSSEPRLSATQSRIERIGNFFIVYQIKEKQAAVHVVALDYNREDLSKEKSERRRD